MRKGGSFEVTSPSSGLVTLGIFNRYNKRVTLLRVLQAQFAFKGELTYREDPN